MENYTDLLTQTNELHRLLVDLKIIAYVATVIASIAMTGMFYCLNAANKTTQTLQQARESQLSYFTKVDLMLENQIYFRSAVKSCLKIMEANSSLLNDTFKPIIGDLKKTCDNYERRMQAIKMKQGNSKNRISINNPDYLRIQELEKQIDMLTKKE